VNPIESLRTAGVAVWIDTLSRDLLETGRFAQWIAQDGVSGATSNPTIFAEALAGESNRYDAEIEKLVAGGQTEPRELFLSLAITDVGAAADLLLDAHRSSGGCDGFVSIECTPDLADDTDATIAQGLDIWSRLDRPNVMVKVPATAAGVPAVAELLAEGVNVNVTLLFAQSRYREILDAFMTGLERRRARGGDPASVASVASFFVSRIDTKVDRQLPQGSPLRGKVAIANAKLAYEMWQERLTEERWTALAAAGARSQRLLWASTGTKSPAYSDVVYVEQLVGPDLINTMPPKTRDAFADHGQVSRTIDADLDAARDALEGLAREGIDLDTVSGELEREGVGSFCASYRDLLATIDRRVRALRPESAATRALS